MDAEIELSLDVNDDSTEDEELLDAEDKEDRSSSPIIQDLDGTQTNVAIDIPDEDQGETEMDDETTNSEADQGETEREDKPLNSVEHVGENSNGIGSDQHHRKRPHLSSSRSILKVPKNIREVDEKAFTPKLVSIGPFHHKNPNLSEMENHKKRFLNRLVGVNHDLLETIRRAMRKIVPRARRYYSESFDLSTDDFAEMLVADGCFILQLFRLIDKIEKKKRHIIDPIFSNRWMLPNIGCDMLMLENQIPFIVLEELHKLTSSPEETTSLNMLALQFLSLFHLGRTKIPHTVKLNVQGPQKHLLAFFQSVYAPTRTKSAQLQANRKRRINQTYRSLNLHLRGKNWVKNATTLKSLGLKFATVQTGNLLDIRFRGRVLKIPTLAIHENNVIILKNMLTYEQCSGDAKPYMTSLIVFLCSVAVVPDDIKLLREATILQHEPGNDEMVIDLLKLLSREIECDINESVLFDQVVSINRYCQSWHARFFPNFRASFAHALGGLAALGVILSIKFLF